jgi:hypothetical protein
LKKPVPWLCHGLWGVWPLFDIVNGFRNRCRGGAIFRYAGKFVSHIIDYYAEK